MSWQFNVKTNPTSSVNITRILSAIVITYLLVACDVDSSNNFPHVPDVGLFIYAEANQHESQDEAQLAAAVFKDGEPVDLVAGDVFEAQTTTQRILLKNSRFFAGSYTALLTVDDNVQDVLFNIVHEPVEAREDRWYPIDIINIDPGPGELVGKSATATFVGPECQLCHHPAMDNTCQCKVS